MPLRLNGHNMGPLTQPIHSSEWREREAAEMSGERRLIGWRIMGRAYACERKDDRV